MPHQDALASAQEIHDFWFIESTPEDWFTKDDGFDAKIRDRFLPRVLNAQQGILDNWADDQELSLSYILLCDQFPRNLFRHDPRAFGSDAKALQAARKAHNRGWPNNASDFAKLFYCLPFMHSENLDDVAHSVAICTQLGPQSHEAAVQHYDIIARFGHYPHRNATLGRISTKEELEFLQQPNSSF